ncbi:hypothetical protein SCARD494_04721 [Seiridium cardinale]
MSLRARCGSLCANILAPLYMDMNINDFDFDFSFGFGFLLEVQLQLSLHIEILSRLENKLGYTGTDYSCYEIVAVFGLNGNVKYALDYSASLHTESFTRLASRLFLDNHGNGSCSMSIRHESWAFHLYSSSLQEP